MNKKCTDPSVPIAIVLLQLAKDEYPKREVIMDRWGGVYIANPGGPEYRLYFPLDDATIGPIYRREAPNLKDYYLKTSWGNYEDVWMELFEIGQSLELQVRAITDMRHPEGCEV